MKKKINDFKLKKGMEVVLNQGPDFGYVGTIISVKNKNKTFLMRVDNHPKIANAKLWFCQDDIKGFLFPVKNGKVIEPAWVKKANKKNK